MKCLYNGKIILNGKIVEGKAVLFDDKIKDIVDENKIGSLENIQKINADGKYISPGFIDLHIHGYLGEDASDGSEEGIKNISKAIAENGVTSFLPTTMTMGIDVIKKAFNTIRKVREEGTEGAEILGIHMEGPFINPSKKGAQDGQYIISPNYDLVKEYEDIISILTIAPEIQGALEFIDKLKRNTNIVISMGHTNATFEQALEGIKYGITHSTHTFNAMTGLHHRTPGVVGAALTSDITCEIIADTIHVHPGLFKFMLKTKGLDKVILITDSIRAGGLTEGEYTLGGQKVIVKDGKSVLEDGTIAGSVLKFNVALNNFNQYTDYDLEQLIQLVTLNPAKVLGVEDTKGTLDIGKDADIIVFDKNINIYLTIGKGKIIYEK